MSVEYNVNFNLATDRDRFYAALRRLRGLHRIDIRKFRHRRSDPQNRRYWGCIVAAFAKFIREQGDVLTELESSDMAHEILKLKFLKHTWTDEKTGEMVDYPGSSAALDTAAFAEFSESCEFFLAELFGYVIPEEVKV